MCGKWWGGWNRGVETKERREKTIKHKYAENPFRFIASFGHGVFLLFPSLFYLQFIQAESSTCMWNLSSTCVECISTDECGWVENGWAGVGVGGRNVRMGGGVIAENTCGRGVSKVGVGGRGWAWV